MVEHQLGYYKWLFGDYIEFVPLNGPFEVVEVFEEAIQKKFNGPFYGWVKYHHDIGEIEGASEALEYWTKFIEEQGPFDGIFGFSQGTFMARILLKFGDFSWFKFGIFFSPVVRTNLKYVT